MTDIVPVRHLPAAVAIAERAAKIGNSTLAAVQENYTGKPSDKQPAEQLDLGPDLKPCRCIGVLPNLKFLLSLRGELQELDGIYR